jgi:hypothetical protein
MITQRTPWRTTMVIPLGVLRGVLQNVLWGVLQDVLWGAFHGVLQVSSREDTFLILFIYRKLYSLVILDSLNKNIVNCVGFVRQKRG